MLEGEFCLPQGSHRNPKESSSTCTNCFIVLICLNFSLGPIVEAVTGTCTRVCLRQSGGNCYLSVPSASRTGLHYAARYGAGVRRGKHPSNARDDIIIHMSDISASSTEFLGMLEHQLQSQPEILVLIRFFARCRRKVFRIFFLNCGPVRATAPIACQHRGYCFYETAASAAWRG